MLCKHRRMASILEVASGASSASESSATQLAGRLIGILPRAKKETARCGWHRRLQASPLEFSRPKVNGMISETPADSPRFPKQIKLSDRKIIRVSRPFSIAFQKRIIKKLAAAMPHAGLCIDHSPEPPLLSSFVLRSPRIVWVFPALVIPYENNNADRGCWWW